CTHEFGADVCDVRQVADRVVAPEDDAAAGNWVNERNGGEPGRQVERGEAGEGRHTHACHDHREEPVVIVGARDVLRSDPRRAGSLVHDIAGDAALDIEVEEGQVR